MVNLLYFQMLVFVSFPFAPYTAIICFGFFYATFRYEVFVVRPFAAIWLAGVTNHLLYSVVSFPEEATEAMECKERRRILHQVLFLDSLHSAGDLSLRFAVRSIAQVMLTPRCISGILQQLRDIE